MHLAVWMMSVIMMILSTLETYIAWFIPYLIENSFALVEVILNTQWIVLARMCQSSRWWALTILFFFSLFSHMLFSSLLFYFVFGDLGLGLMWYHCHTIIYQAHNTVTVTVTYYMEKYRRFWKDDVIQHI